MTKGENSSICQLQDVDRHDIPKHHVKAVEGGTAVLPCSVDYQRSVATSTVEWKKNCESIVHVYKHGADSFDDQDEEFKNRTTLHHEGLKSGNMTLTLRSVRSSDKGRYICNIPKEGIYGYVILDIVPKGQNNMTKRENPSTPGPPDTQDESGYSNTVLAIAIAILISISILICVGILLARRHRAKKRDKEDQTVLPNTNDQEMSLLSSNSSKMNNNQASAEPMVTYAETPC